MLSTRSAIYQERSGRPLGPGAVDENFPLYRVVFSGEADRVLAGEGWVSGEMNDDLAFMAKSEVNSLVATEIWVVSPGGEEEESRLDEDEDGNGDGDANENEDETEDEENVDGD